ncbi:MAG: efflux RND transporter periplasmic adaptor subunit [Muribaculaceae bacterium]|nr:efflux RND transporter periplasmic adaptor subunit [Muribaculaceae bacterium]
MKTVQLISSSAVFAVLLIGLVGCNRHNTIDNERGDTASPMTVDVAYPYVDSITISQEFPATISADKAVDVVARVDGYVTAKYFESGDYVRSGQLLFRIEDSQYHNAVSQAQASLESAQSQASYAEKQYAAMKRAYESEAVSHMDVEKAQDAVNSAKASIKVAEAQLRTAQTNLGYCTVRALASGHIKDANVNVGDYVGGEDDPITLTTIYDDAIVQAVFALNDKDFFDITSSGNVEKSQLESVPVTFSQPLTNEYRGAISYLAPDIDKSTGTMTIKIKLDNRTGELKDGMYATVHLPVKRDNHALLVKDAAISSNQKGKYVYTVGKDNKVVYTPIEVGEIYQDSLRVVLSGLNPDSKYVTKALLKVRDGMTVKPRLIKK